MDHVLTRWLILGSGLIVSGSAAWVAVGSLLSPRGVPGPGVSDAIAPFSASIALLVAFVICTAVAAIVGRLLNPVVGLFTLGTGLGIAALRSGTVRDACFDGGSLIPLAMESLVWGVLLAGAAIVIYRVAHSATVRSTDEQGFLRETFCADSLKIAAIGAVAIVGVWLLITSELKGQAVGAAIVGGLLAGHVAKRVVPGRDPVLLYATPVLAVGAAQFLLAWFVADPASEFVRGTIPNLLVVMPLDLASGSVVGVAIGVGMARPVA